MKSRITDTKTNGHAAAQGSNSATVNATPSYQIDDRRGASIMQRKFRNLANGLASANIIDNRPQSLQMKAASLQAKTSGQHNPLNSSSLNKESAD